MIGVQSSQQESRVFIANNLQRGRFSVISSKAGNTLKGRLIFNFQATRSAINIALLNNQSNS